MQCTSKKQSIPAVKLSVAWVSESTSQWVHKSVSPQSAEYIKPQDTVLCGCGISIVYYSLSTLNSADTVLVIKLFLGPKISCGDWYIILALIHGMLECIIYSWKEWKLTILIVWMGNFYFLLQNLSRLCYQLFMPGNLQSTLTGLGEIAVAFQSPPARVSGWLL